MNEICKEYDDDNTRCYCCEYRNKNIERCAFYHESD